MLGKMELELPKVVNESIFLFFFVLEIKHNKIYMFSKLGCLQNATLKLFEERERYARFTRLNIELGIDPCNSLVLKSISSSESNWNSPI